jgi:anti-sigma B factor antagonist
MSSPDPPDFALRSTVLPATPSGSALVVEVVGEVDMTTASELSEALEAAPEGTTWVVIDLSEVSFLDSSGLNALVQARRLLAERGLALRVVVPAEGAIRRVFEITHLTEPLTVVDSRPSPLP